MRIGFPVVQAQCVFGFLFKVLSCLELAKHNIFVLTLDCSLKKWQRKTFQVEFILQCIWFLLGCVAVQMLFWSRIESLKVATVPGLE